MMPGPLVITDEAISSPPIHCWPAMWSRSPRCGKLVPGSGIATQNLEDFSDASRKMLNMMGVVVASGQRLRRRLSRSPVSSDLTDAAQSVASARKELGKYVKGGSYPITSKRCFATSRHRCSGAGDD